MSSILVNRRRRVSNSAEHRHRSGVFHSSPPQRQSPLKLTFPIKTGKTALPPRAPYGVRATGNGRMGGQKVRNLKMGLLTTSA